jgi:hypothetical protein
MCQQKQANHNDQTAIPFFTGRDFTEGNEDNKEKPSGRLRGRVNEGLERRIGPHESKFDF